jgi:hypothetical protein
MPRQNANCILNPPSECGQITDPTFKECALFLPLPQGEGWGEGGIAVKYSLILSFSQGEKEHRGKGGTHYLPTCSVKQHRIT